MMIVMSPQATGEQKQFVIDKVSKAGLHVATIDGEMNFVIGAVGDPDLVIEMGLEGLPGVDKVLPKSYLLRADYDWSRPDARREFLRALTNEAGGVDLFPSQGSGVLSSCVQADGLVDNPPGQAVKRGDLVRFIPFSELLD